MMPPDRGRRCPLSGTIVIGLDAAVSKVIDETPERFALLGI
jgi:hypothetical protein